MDLDISLLPWQQEVWSSGSRFSVIAAGRRTGKSLLARARMVVTALENPGCNVFYIAPTQMQARDIMWNELLDFTAGIRKSSNVNNLQVELINGSRISLKGSDRPDTMRGVKLRLVVLDEYAEMKPEVWEEIILPALADLQGDAIFIGTPKGRNHFYDLYNYALAGGDPDYRAWHFTTYDNPIIKKSEIEAAKRRMSSHAFRQEFMASFEAAGSSIFNEDWVVFDAVEPIHGDYYVTVDIAGFAEPGRSKKKRDDDTAIAVVKVNEQGWWVKEIITGRWTVDETAAQIFEAANDNSAVAVGIEQGISKKAVMSPLLDIQQRMGRFLNIVELTHGNQNKVDRIVWALQGRFENKLITLNRGEWNIKFLDELFQFPDKLTHDDMVDALAYIDQIAKVPYGIDFDEYRNYEYEVLDEISGY